MVAALNLDNGMLLNTADFFLPIPPPTILLCPLRPSPPHLTEARGRGGNEWGESLKGLGGIYRGEPSAMHPALEAAGGRAEDLGFGV